MSACIPSRLLFRPCSLLGLMGLVATMGCGQTASSEWVITVANQSPSPCSIVVEMGYENRSGQGSSEASVDEVPAGDRLTLVTGTLSTTIRSVNVRCGEKEHALEPNAVLHPGESYSIVITPESELRANVAP